MTDEETERLMDRTIEVIARSLKSDAELSKLSGKQSAFIVALAAASVCATFISDIIEAREADDTARTREVG